jgi:cytochrome c biogenesis protein CcmG/thiol:disulfide interchange protein DsbE
VSDVKSEPISEDSQRSVEPEGDGFFYPLSLGAVVLALVIAIAFVPRMMPHGKMGGDAPDFTADLVANSPDAKSFHLAEQRGHPVLLDFWATWCGPCKAQSPIVNRIATRYKDRGLVVVGVNTSDEEGMAAAYVKGHGLSFPMAYDRGNAAARAYDVENLPTMVLISKTGKLIAVRQGMTSDDELDRLVRSAL